MEKTMTKGKQFIEELKSGAFPKINLPNHGKEFTGGLEGMYYYFFDRYISSCGCFLMDQRMTREEYHG